MRIDRSSKLSSIIIMCPLLFSIQLGCKKKDPDLEENQVFKELVETGQVTDFSGRSYGTVKLGSRWWMAENLATSKYSDGEDISLLSNETAWIELSGPGYCWYSNDEVSNTDGYGALYNWYAINTEKLCPSGWHVPSDIEWNELIDFIGSLGHTDAEAFALKATSGWSNNSNGGDIFGFGALPAGYRSGNGQFKQKEDYGIWWSSSILEGFTRKWYMDNAGGLVLNDYSLGKANGFSVRCVKNQ